MKKLAIVLAMTMVSGMALAQQQPSTTEQALGQRVLNEINANIKCNADLLDLQRQLKAATATKEPEAPAKEK